MQVICFGEQFLQKRLKRQKKNTILATLVNNSKNHKGIIIQSIKDIHSDKYWIQKFEFYLRGYHFLVQMDNSSVPMVLGFENKTLPDSQLLRLKDLFAKYDFSVQDMKRDLNLILGMLSKQKHIQVTALISTFHLTFIACTPRCLKANVQIGFLPTLKDVSIVSQIQSFAKYHCVYYLDQHPHQKSFFESPRSFLSRCTLSSSTLDPSKIFW